MDFGGENLNGVLNLIKPPGMTSFDATAFIRRLLHVKKAGHCGTLDPDATGVLPVCVGTATKVAGMLTDTRKAYRVEAVAGLLTDTLDLSGTVIAEDSRRLPDRETVSLALGSFAGVHMQTPPMFSAVKIDGRKLYDLARKGIEAAPAPRPVEIHKIAAVSVNPDRLIFDVECSKGTYIRALCRDLGDRLGAYLCMSFLIRTKSAGLSIDNSLTIEKIIRLKNENAINNALIPADELLAGYIKIELTDGQYNRFMNGAAVNIGRTADYAAQPALAYRDGRFVGLGEIFALDAESAVLRAKKLFIEPDGRRNDA